MANIVLCRVFVIKDIFLMRERCFFMEKIKGAVHMNPQVVEYYESLFKFEIMQEPKPLKELVEQYVGHDASHEQSILAAYANVLKELRG